MASRFEEDPTLLTPETAVRVVERFAARQREQDADVSQSSGMTHVQELADLLGTTPEDVLKLAEESRPKTQLRQAPISIAKPQWPLHIAYLSAIGLALVLAVVTPRTEAVVPPVPMVAAPLAVPATPVVAKEPTLPVAPTFPGRNWQDQEIPIMGVGVILPPAGVKVRLVEQWGKLTLEGPPGLRVDDEMSRATFRSAVQSLLKHHEKSEVSKFTGRKIDFREVPKDLLNAELPLTVGWHRLEVSNGSHFFTALVPDLRFAKDLSRAQALVNREIERLAQQVLKK